MGKPKLGRPKIPDSEKAVYQRIGIEYKVYRKLLDIEAKLRTKYQSAEHTHSTVLDRALDMLDEKI